MNKFLIVFSILILFSVNTYSAEETDCKETLAATGEDADKIYRNKYGWTTVRVLPPHLLTFAKNLTLQASLDLELPPFLRKLDPLLGRESEINRLIDILNQRKLGSALLVGPPGVGKTAIVEGLAQRIVVGDVPSSLKDKTILVLNASELVGGTTLRGMFEERIAKILGEIKENPKFIIFIDEAHTLKGAGSALGAPTDAMDMLKPALSNGDLKSVTSGKAGGLNM